MTKKSPIPARALAQCSAAALCALALVSGCSSRASDAVEPEAQSATAEGGAATDAARENDAGPARGATHTQDDAAAPDAALTSADSDAATAAPDAANPLPAPATSVVDGPDAQAFDPINGVLNVDYASYLAKHDIVFNQPNTEPRHGLTVGNGRSGAMVWSERGLTLQVAGVDTSQQSAFAAGLVNLETTPPLEAGPARYQQRLALYDGSLVTRYADDRTVTIFGSPNSELLGIHVEDARSDVSAVTLELSLWPLDTLQNSGAVPNLNSWKSVGSYADASGAGLSRGQTDPDHFGYTLAAAAEGSSFTTEALGNGRVRLHIAPSASYTLWIAVATRINAPGNDSLAQAKALLKAGRDAGYTATLARYHAFWHDFWRRSFVQYSNPAKDADYLENVYYLATYMIAAGGYGNYPFHFINGVFRATHDDTKWSNAYWYWNQRDVYNSFLASNHADLIAVFNRLYSRNVDTLKALSMKRYGIDGVWVPETMGWNGNADGTVGSDFTKNVYSTGAEAAQNMYLQYAYTGDAAYLKDAAYPFMREAAKFYLKKLSYDTASGKYSMASSNAHETYWNVVNAITDLAAVRMLFPLVIRVSQQLDLDAALRTEWQQVLDQLVAYPTDGKSYLPHQPPTAQSRNGENVACELIWPYGVTGLGAADYAMALSTWKARPFPYGNVWANDAVQAARLGLGDETKTGMRTMLQRYQSFPNGMTNNDNGVFEYLGVHLAALNEALLQSHDDKIRVTPALPTEAGFVARFTLLAKGGFLVSAEQEGDDLKYVGLKSLLGNRASLINPWSGEARVRRLRDDKVLLTSSARELAFDTEPQGIYVIERSARPLTSYVYARIVGSRNEGAKTMGSNRLGIAPK